MALTILELAIAFGAHADESGAVNGEELAKQGFAIFGGCARCGACLSAGNGYPARNGYWSCEGCLEESAGFETVAEFEAWGESLEA